MDIMVFCETENGSIGSGMSDIESIDEFKANLWDVLPGLSESYWECWEDFEEDVIKAAEESVSIIKREQIESDEERSEVARECAEKVFKPLYVSYRIDDEFIDGDLGIDGTIFTETLFDMLLEDVMNEISLKLKAPKGTH